MKNVRIQLRHCGAPPYRIGVETRLFGWGYNIRLWRWFIAVRRPVPNGRGLNQKLVNFQFGTSILQQWKEQSR
jgi:hypothetical protein